jgi:hypothetical protein
MFVFVVYCGLKFNVFGIDICILLHIKNTHTQQEQARGVLDSSTGTAE